MGQLTLILLQNKADDYSLAELICCGTAKGLTLGKRAIIFGDIPVKC